MRHKKQIYHLTHQDHHIRCQKIVFVIFIEIIVGITMYYGDFPVLSQPIHLLLATILFGLQFYWILHIKKNII